MSLREIAQQAGVSVTTVSRILNDTHRNKVSEETRVRVQDIARAMCYRPNPQAAALASRRPPNRLGLVLPYHSHVFESHYITEAIRGAVDGAKAAQFSVALLMPDSASAEGMRSEILLNRGSLAGLLLLGANVGFDAPGCCREAGVPLVAINDRVEDAEISTVDCDNVGGAQAVTEHLIRLGHTKIAYIAGPKESANARDRYTGFRRAMEEAGFGVDEVMVENGRFEEREGREAMKRLLAKGRPFTALVCANDSMALGAYKVSRREGLQIPADLAIVGFDDIPLAEYVEPALTTVHQPIYRIGRRAAEILTRRVLDADADGTAGVREVFRTRVVIRESCGARTPGRQP